MPTVWKNRADAMKAAATRRSESESKSETKAEGGKEELPSSYHSYKGTNANASTKMTKRERQTKALGARYPTGKAAETIMKNAADRRANKSAIFAKNKADKTTGGKGASPFDSREDQKKYNDVRTAASKQSPDRPTGTKSQQIKWRVENKDFKGAYYGPDKFKGDLKAIKKWKAAGKPRNSDGTPKG